MSRTKSLAVIIASFGSLLLAVAPNMVAPAIAADGTMDVAAEARRAVQSRDEQRVKEIAKQISTLAPAIKTALLNEWRPLLRSSDWQQQSAAAVAIGALGAMAAPAVPEMVRASDAEMENVSWAVEAAIGSIGKPAVPYLAEALKRSPRDIKHGWHLMSMVKRLGPNGAELAPHVVPFLYDGANTGAVQALKSMGPAAVPAICRAIENDGQGMITVYAGETLEAFPTQAAPILGRMVSGSNPIAAKNASYILSHLPKVGPSAATGLAQGLLAENTASTARDALVKCGAPCVPDVLEVLGNSSQVVRLRTLEVLRKMGPAAAKAMPKLTTMLPVASPASLKSTVAATMLSIDASSKPAQDALMALLSSSKSDERRDAAIALAQAKSNGSALTGKLAQLLRDPDSPVRIAAAGALGAIGSRASAAVPALIQAATSEHPSVTNAFERFGMTSDVQGAAVSALAEIGDSSQGALSVLSDAISKPGMNTEQIFASFAKMGPRASSVVPLLVKLLQRKNYGQTEEVIDALAAMRTSASAALPELNRIALDKSASSFHRKKALQAIDAIETSVPKKQQLARAVIGEFELREYATSMLSKYPSGDGANLKLLVDGLNDGNLEVRWRSIEALGNMGASAESAIPIMLKQNLGCSFMPDQRSRAWKAIRQIDPTGAKTIPLLQKSLKDAFEVRSAVELLEYINSPAARQLATETRAKWKLRD